jgi:6-phospho-beta-glucosidase
MARIRIAYLGGGSTRAAGTMASFAHQGADFDGSEVCLIDLDEERLDLIRRLAQRMMRARGLDIEVTATTDRRAGLAGCDAVLSSFRPGGFAARAEDERIPLRHGVIGQETQGPGGFFMALRSINVLREVADELSAVAPGAKVFNYTNPVNIVAEAWTHHSDIPLVSLCEGPIIFPRGLARDVGLDGDRADARMVGLNHASWAVEQTYDGGDLGAVLAERWEELRGRPDVPADVRRRLEIAVTMGHVGADYFAYYYFEDDLVRELRARPTTRAQDIASWAPGYWDHYREQAERDDPVLDPERSRGGIHELELAIDVMDAIYNGKDEVHPVNVPNAGGALPGFPHDMVVEITGRTRGGWIEPLPQPALPRHVAGLVEALGEYQALAAEAAWRGTRADGVRALCANPLVRTLPKAEAIYDEMAAAHRAHLPERLVA